MEWIDSIAGFIANPWVSWLVTALFAAASVFLKYKVGNIKAIASELIDIAKVHKAAKDPKGEAGAAYSDNERAKLDKEFQELLTALATAIGKSANTT